MILDTSASSVSAARSSCVKVTLCRADRSRTLGRQAPAPVRRQAFSLLGSLTVLGSAAGDLSSLVSGYVKAIEIDELDKRIAALEQRAGSAERR